MIVLDTTSKVIQVDLDGAVTTNQLRCTAHYDDITTTSFTPASTRAVTNNTTAVTLVSAPSASTQRNVQQIEIYNKDTVVATVTVQLYDGTNTDEVIKAALNPGDTLHYGNGAWYVSALSLPASTELDYVQFTSNVTPSATTEGTADVVVTGNAVTYSGTQAVVVEFFANNARPAFDAAGRSMTFWLYEDGASIGQIGLIVTPAASTAISVVHAVRRITPSSGSHTYSIRASVSAGTGLVAAGTGGSGTTAPGFIRITRAN